MPVCGYGPAPFYRPYVGAPALQRHLNRDSFSESRRTLGEFGETTPGGKTFAELLAIERSAKQMSLERKVLPDRAEARQEHLGAFRIAKTTHAALALSRRLMAVFSTLVDPGTGFDEDVLDVCQFGDLSFCRRIATQLVGHDLAWHFGTRGKHAFEKALGCSPYRDGFAAGYRVRHRADRLVATADKARRAASQTLRPDAMWYRACDAQLSRDARSPRRTCRTSAGRFRPYGTSFGA